MGVRGVFCGHGIVCEQEIFCGQVDGSIFEHRGGRDFAGGLVEALYVLSEVRRKSVYVSILAKFQHQLPSDFELLSSIHGVRGWICLRCLCFHRPGVDQGAIVPCYDQVISFSVMSSRD